MLDWKARFNGKSALLIEGARRIGKSTIAEEFARKEYEDFVAIDFSVAGKEIVELFDDIADLNMFFLRLQAITGKNLPLRKSVIIFDEVQLCPKARQAIKHLVRDGRYDYIETGSLLSIKKNVKDILIPSEETHLAMFPMDFEEFLWAIGKEATFELIRHSFVNLRPLGDAIHRRIMQDFRLYILIGGMPQAVNSYLETNDFVTIDEVKRNILDLYESDLRKIDSTGKASAIFKSVPAELARNTQRYKVGSVIENTRPSRLSTIFADIADSMTVNFAYHSNDPGTGLALHADYNFFKLYLSDTGLFITLAFKDRSFIDNEIYRKLLFDKLSTDLGYVYENVVAQLLRAAGNSLYYYTFKAKQEDNKTERPYEVDFLVVARDKICPIEVKSSTYNSHKSLDMFQNKYSQRIANSYLLYTKDLRRDKQVICLPIYMAGLL